MRARGRVLVGDADPHIREMVGVALSVNGYAVTGVANGADALRSALYEPPNIAILDVHLPIASGYQVCRTLREELGDSIGIIFISGERTESVDRVAGLLLGADDYLVKPLALDELVARAHRLERRASVPTTAAAKLTPREREVLGLLARGLDAAGIARGLFLSPKTIDKHIEHILLKLGVHSRAQAVAFALREQVVQSAVDAEPTVGLASTPHVYRLR